MSMHSLCSSDTDSVPRIPVQAGYWELQGTWLGEGRKGSQWKMHYNPRETLGEKCKTHASELSQPRRGVGEFWHLLTLSLQSLVKQFPSGGSNSSPPCVGKTSPGNPSTKTQLMADGSQADM